MTTNNSSASDYESTYGTLQPYSAEPWMSKLQKIPTVRIHLAMTPTPIHIWNLPGVPQNYKVYVKRDDLTGSALTGNKVRKLEFIFGHILQKGYKNVTTIGSVKSNHCRATAIIASQLGIKCHLFLRSESKTIEGSSKGNFFLARMCDANVYLAPIDSQYVRDFGPRTKALAEAILQEKGETTYEMPAGASNSLGLFGYLNAWQEMMDQGVLEKFDDLVLVCGSGGTLSGLAIGNYLTGTKLKIHAITVFYPAKFFYDHLDTMLTEMGLDDVKSEDLVDVIEGYVGAGYGKSTPEDHNLYKTIAAATGIFCDPVYIGKGAKGLISELNSNPSRFQGKRILFLHTGGIFGLYDGRMFDIFTNEKVHDWFDVEKSPKEFM